MKLDIKLVAAITIMVGLLAGSGAVLYDMITDHSQDDTGVKMEPSKPGSEGLMISESTAKEMNLKIEEITSKPIPVIITGSAIISQNLDKMYVDITAARAGVVKLNKRAGTAIARGGVIASVDGNPVTANESGMIMDVWVNDGETLYIGQKIATIMNLSTVWVLADIPQDQLSDLRIGEGANVQLDAFPDRTWSGTVSYISPTLNPNTFTASVRIVLPNSNLELKPNMTATVQITGSSKGNGIIIPQTAIAEIGSRKIVYVQNEDKSLSKRDVMVKELTAGNYEVIQGLTVGENIVTQGAYYLKSQEQINQK